MKITTILPARFFLFAATLLMPLSALAYGFGFLHNEIVSDFNTEDWSKFDEALIHTLDNLPDKQIHTWSNPKTGKGGAMTVLDSTIENDKPCRRLRIINSSGDRKGRSTFTFCKKPPDDTWLVKPDDARKSPPETSAPSAEEN